MAATPEVDQLLRKAIKLFHSSHPDSAVELRMLLDEEVRKRHGPEKMFINSLPQHVLELERNFPGMKTPSATSKEPPESSTDVINLTNSPARTISDSPDTILDSDDGMSHSGAGVLTTGEDDGNLKEFGDLNCCVCGEMMFTATNRLIECSKCSTLYHQECHKPTITNEEASEGQVQHWECDTCFNKPSTSKAAGIAPPPDEPMPLIGKINISPHSDEPSSNSSSPFYKHDPATSSSAATTTAKSASTKHHKSSKSHKERDRPSSSSSKSSMHASVERSSSHSSRSKTHSSSKSSSSKSSKHHESGSSKRKGK